MAAISTRIVQALQEAGVRTLFGVPGGGSNLDLIDAAASAGLPFVLTSTETGAAIAAIAQAEITGRPGACLTTLGPGAASVVNGIACAHLERAPLFVFTDSHPSKAAGAFTHQQIDQRAMLGAMTRWSGRLSPDHVDGVLDYAWRAVLGPPPGPVLIECPSDFETEKIASAVLDVPAPVAVESTDPAQLQTLVSSARKPLVIAGLGARRAEDAEALRRLCERRQVPAMVTYKAKGVIPDDHPRFAGVFTNGALEQALVAQSDLILAVGLDPVELLPRPWTTTQPVVHVGPWPVSNAHVPVTGHLAADVAAAVDRLESWLWWSDWDFAAIARSVAECISRVDVPAQGLTAQRVIDALSHELMPRARVTVDAGAHMFAATLLCPVSEPNQMLISNGLSTMGFALPAAIGAALLDRTRPVVAITGDGGLLMCAGELLTVVRERLRIIVVVLNDASLSLIEIKQRLRGLTPRGVGLGEVDWRRLAEGFGITAFRAADASQLAEAIDRALAVSGPVLIEAIVDRSNYAATMKAVRG